MKLGGGRLPFTQHPYLSFRPNQADIYPAGVWRGLTVLVSGCRSLFNSPKRLRSIRCTRIVRPRWLQLQPKDLIEHIVKIHFCFNFKGSNLQRDNII